MGARPTSGGLRGPPIDDWKYTSEYLGGTMKSGAVLQMLWRSWHGYPLDLNIYRILYLQGVQEEIPCESKGPLYAFSLFAFPFMTSFTSLLCLIFSFPGSLPFHFLLAYCFTFNILKKYSTSLLHNLKKENLHELEIMNVYLYNSVMLYIICITFHIQIFLALPFLPHCHVP